MWWIIPTVISVVSLIFLVWPSGSSGSKREPNRSENINAHILGAIANVAGAGFQAVDALFKLFVVIVLNSITWIAYLIIRLVWGIV